jgi:hypothetical protein
VSKRNHWTPFVAETERRLREAKSEKRIEELGLALATFRRFEELRVPWPLKRRRK